ncbi:MAG: CRISPR-associated endonuclease Cas3'' [Gemmiger sp.]
MAQDTAKPRLAHLSSDGKRTQTVQAHLEGTAHLAAGFAKPFGGGSQARLAGLLHDIGKYSEDFQLRLAGGPPVDHSTAGAQVAFALRQPEAAFAVAGHHGGLPDGGGKSDPPDSPTLLGRCKKTVSPCDGWREEIVLPEPHRPPLPKDGFSTAFYIRMLYSCLVDADYLDTETFMNGAPFDRGGGDPPEVLLSRLRAYVAPWWNPATALNRQRCEILRRCFAQGEAAYPGLFTLTVPTGGGKTVSSLAFALAHAVAHQKRRVVYVIPYTSIIDQTEAIFTEILGEKNVLAHHSGSEATLTDLKTDGSPSPKVLATENWDAPVIVTTAVQFFESLFANRSSRCRKLHNLADSVVIFDEAQTLPVPYLRPCVAAIGQLVQHYGVTAVLCTATQPALGSLFAELAPGLRIREIMEDPAGLYAFFCRTTLHQAGEWTEEALAGRLSDTEQVLCVVNRRATAQRLFGMLPREGRYCLTTLLCPADRKRLLDEIRTRLLRGAPCRVVATSLIEAGVDLDFPAVWREEAGLDSVLQAAGRCNREGKRPAGQSPVLVFRLAGQPVPAMIRPNTEAARTVLRDFADPAQPEAIEAYFSLFLTLKGPEELDQKGILPGFARGMEGRMLPFATAAERFRLIESPAVTVYPALPENQSLLGTLRAGVCNRTLYRRLGQYGVTVYPQHLAALQAAGAVEALDQETWILRDTTLYDRHTGLSLDVPTGQGWMI